MPAPFVPFQAVVPGAAGNTARVPAQLPSTSPRNALPTPGQVTEATPSKVTAAFGPLTNAEQCPQPQISIQREGDRITCIRIQCSCGQLIELDCAY